jgi:crotonobetainyl-CoA:carnitine CoA-transferase CaiB-like acyl-CoA transferase
MMKPSLPLSNVTVVALEQAVAAPLCTRHLADLGADVIKIERPDGGDFARHYDGVARGQSSYFAWLNPGKRSVVLNLKLAEDRLLLDRLLGRADVFVHNLGPGAVERLGLGWAALHARWPRLIWCAISGYGLDGPYRDRKAFDLLLQGESGLLSVTGLPEQPAKVGVSIADISAGMYAFAAVLATLYEREQTGEGRLIDISMLECLAEWLTQPTYFQLYAGQAPPRTGARHATIVPYGPYRVANGWVNFAVQNDSQWERFCRLVLGQSDLSADRRFASNELRVRYRATLEPLIDEILARLTRSEVLRRLEAADVPYGALNNLGDLVAHPQLAARDRWLDVASPAGPLRALKHPLNVSGMPRRAGAIPALGEHTEEVRRELAQVSEEGVKG